MQVVLPIPDPVLRERARCTAIAEAASNRWAREHRATDRHRKVAVQVADAIAASIRTEAMPPWLLLDDWTEDERRVLLAVADRLRKGRAHYGPLVIAERGKTMDFHVEANEELLDAIAYLTMDSLRKAR